MGLLLIGSKQDLKLMVQFSFELLTSSVIDSLSLRTIKKFIKSILIKFKNFSHNIGKLRSLFTSVDIVSNLTTDILDKTISRAFLAIP